MTKENLRKILKSYTTSALKNDMVYVYNDNGEMKEVLTNKVVDAIVDLIIEELKKE